MYPTTFEFHIISLDGKYWVFDAGSAEVTTTINKFE